MGSNRDLNYVQALLHDSPAYADPTGAGFQHQLPNQGFKTPGQIDRRRSTKQSCSDVSMRNFPDEQNPLSLSRGLTSHSDDPSAKSLNIGELQLETAPLGNPTSRKRPLDSDVNPPRISSPSGQASKFACRASGTFDAFTSPNRGSGVVSPLQLLNPQVIRDPPREALPERDPPQKSQPERDRPSNQRSLDDHSSPLSQFQKAPLRSPLNIHGQRSYQRPRVAEYNQRQSRDLHEYSQRSKRSYPIICETANETVERNREFILNCVRNNLDQAEDDEDLEDPANVGLIGQPHSRPIPQELLQKEVDGIHHVVEQVESKCSAKVREEAEAIRLRRQQNIPQPDLDRKYWQSMVGIHRVLLHEFHDFFLASQHPTARESIRGKAQREAMPARMWKYGIHDFLELLRSLLPRSYEYMVSFLLLAYEMVALLYETVPSLEETWMECLGDLARYRMAVEEQDRDLRDIWSDTSRYWYDRVMDIHPQVGRLQHHIAILSRHRMLEQLSLYCRSLTANQPFSKTRDSIEHLFRPVLSRQATAHRSMEEQFVRLHALMLKKETTEDFDKAAVGFLRSFEQNFFQRGKDAQDTLSWMAVSNIASLIEYESLSKQTAASTKIVTDLDENKLPSQSTITISRAQKLSFGMLKIVLEHLQDRHAVTHIHFLLILIHRLASILQQNGLKADDGAAYILGNVPHKNLCEFFNFHIQKGNPFRITSKDLDTLNSEFPEKRSASGEIWILPEDRIQRGQSWSIGYLPEDWLSDLSKRSDPSVTAYYNAAARLGRIHSGPRDQYELRFYDDFGRIKETNLTPRIRMLRVIHLAMRIAKLRPCAEESPLSSQKIQEWLVFDPEQNVFELYSVYQKRQNMNLSRKRSSTGIKLEDGDSQMLFRGEHDLSRHTSGPDPPPYEEKKLQDVKMEDG